MPWRLNLSLKKYTFCDYWTKIVAQSWFGARIYSRALTLGSWPLNFRIKILKYTFFLVFVKKIFSPIRPMVQKIIRDELVTTDRQTDRQRDRQTFLSWPPSIWEILILIFYFFLHMGGRERMGGNLYLLACYASSLCSLALLAGG
jgi:hypothetical protein